MKKQSIKITDIALLLLFSVFALCLLLLLLTGAEIYRDINSMAEQAHTRRTADRYISTRVRQADSSEQLSIGSFDGCQALCISEDIDGQSYLTRIYCFDGGIRELFSEADSPVKASDGERLIPAESMSFSLDGNRLYVQLSQDGCSRSIELMLRSGGETA